MFSTDDKSYKGSDSGCILASHFLGRQSHCLECPFDLCLTDNESMDEKRQILESKEKQLDKARSEKNAWANAVRDYRQVFGDFESPPGFGEGLSPPSVRSYRKIFRTFDSRRWDSDAWQLAVYEYRQIFESPEK